MSLKVDVPVSVVSAYDSKKSKVFPLLVKWDGREYKIIKIGFHHSFRQGRTLFHVFSAASDTAFFRLVLDTDTLFWRLTEVSE